MDKKPLLTPRVYLGLSILEVLRIIAIGFVSAIINMALFSDSYLLMIIGIITGVITGLTSKILYFPATLIALWVIWPLLAFCLLFDERTVGALIVTTFMCLTGAFVVFGRLLRIGRKLDDKNPLND